LNKAWFAAPEHSPFPGLNTQDWFTQESAMLRVILIVVLFLMLIGSLPVWSFNTGWGYAPSGLFTILLIALLLFIFRGRSRV
jgi:hypothetical protein